ncbi:hypothetical protein XENORESO_008485 [Xenotaenia resolanae]|uniref:Uncharacterized protein n=1 Tax=Xenotaenia resolanae TaxID=208358 RepID=A0ABV0WDS2_9TELE
MLDHLLKFIVHRTASDTERPSSYFRLLISTMIYFLNPGAIFDLIARSPASSNKLFNLFKSPGDFLQVDQKYT